MPVYENERGTYIFNSKDLCMIEHIDDIIDAGIDSLKIEGRMKTALYVATVARTYRKAIDDYLKDPEIYKENMAWYQEQIKSCTYRQFTTGFFYGKPDETTQIYDCLLYTSKQEIVDVALKINTYETSILPYEDCCTIFVAKHPVTKPNLQIIKRSEEKLQEKIDEMMKEAVETAETIICE